MDELELFRALMSQINQNSKEFPKIMQELQALQYKVQNIEEAVNIETIKEHAVWKQKTQDDIDSWLRVRDDLTASNREYKWKFGQWEAKYSTLLWLLGIIMAAFWKEIAALIMN